MFFSPVVLLFTWLAGLLSLALLGGGMYLLWAWYVGAVVGTAWLVLGTLMTVWAFAGRWIVLRFRSARPDEPSDLPRPASAALHRRPDGTSLGLSTYGPPDAPTIVLTHGAGTNSSSWYYLQRHLADTFRIVAWDLPGLGRSSKPAAGDYSLDRHASALAAIVEQASRRGPVVLVGHSMGGMIILTLCRMFPELVSTHVAGLVLVDSSPTNPVLTTTASRVLRVLQKPLLEPLLHVTAWTAPLVWVMSWLSYVNGSAHLLSMLFGFAGQESRGQLDRATRYNPQASPAVQARESLAMFRYDATRVLESVRVPALCVTGDTDRLITPETSRTMAGHLSGGAFLQIGPAGHMSIFEQHEQLTAAIREFAEQTFAVHMKDELRLA